MQTTPDERDELLDCRMAMLGLKLDPTEIADAEAFGEMMRRCVSCGYREACAVDARSASGERAGLASSLGSFPATVWHALRRCILGRCCARRRGVIGVARPRSERNEFECGGDAVSGP